MLVIIAHRWRVVKENFTQEKQKGFPYLRSPVLLLSNMDGGKNMKKTKFI
jgi:hypothetical protein